MLQIYQHTYHYSQYLILPLRIARLVYLRFTVLGTILGSVVNDHGKKLPPVFPLAHIKPFLQQAQGGQLIALSHAVDQRKQTPPHRGFVQLFPEACHGRAPVPVSHTPPPFPHLKHGGWGAVRCIAAPSAPIRSMR
jgi:hypothetical protein